MSLTCRIEGLEAAVLSRLSIRGPGSQANDFVSLLQKRDLTIFSNEHLIKVLCMYVYKIYTYTHKKTQL